MVCPRRIVLLVAALAAAPVLALPAGAPLIAERVAPAAVSHDRFRRASLSKRDEERTVKNKLQETPWGPILVPDDDENEALYSSQQDSHAPLKRRDEPQPQSRYSNDEPYQNDLYEQNSYPGRPPPFNPAAPPLPPKIPLSDQLHTQVHELSALESQQRSSTSPSSPLSRLQPPISELPADVPHQQQQQQQQHVFKSKTPYPLSPLLSPSSGVLGGQADSGPAAAAAARPPHTDNVNSHNSNSQGGESTSTPLLPGRTDTSISAMSSNRRQIKALVKQHLYTLFDKARRFFGVGGGANYGF